MGEIKQANFRINTEDADKFREFCEQSGMNQAQGFDHLMQVLELDKAKATVPTRATEIEEFERHVKALISAYLTSMEIAESTEERILEQFQSKLDSKDKIIIDLQNRLSGTEDLLTAAQSAAMEAENKVEAAEQASADAKERAKSAEQTAKDKEEIANMLNMENIKLKTQLDGYDALKDSETSLKAQLAEALQTIKDNQREAEIAQERAVAAIQKEIDKTVAEHEKAVAELQADKDRAVAFAQIDREKTVAAAEKSHQELMQKMYEKIEKLQEEKSDLKDTLSSVKQQNRELLVELETLRAYEQENK